MSTLPGKDSAMDVSPERFTCTEDDVRVIRWQLKQDDIFISGVVERCEYGFPRVMLLNPLPGSETGGAPRYEAITNLIWLTCPYLNERIHGLEQEGLIEKITELINGDLEMRTMMDAAHARFYYLRKNYYRRFFGPEQEDGAARLFNAGIAGIRDIRTVKCLHAHFSHFRICDDNAVGMITSRLLDDKINCDEVRCRDAG